MVRRLTTVAVFVLAAATLASAQEVTTILINVPISQRNPGVYETPSTVLAPTVQEVLFRIHIPTAEYEDSLNEVRIRVYYLDDVGVWRSISGPIGVVWKGGRYVDEDGNINPPVTYSPGLDPLRGRAVKAEFEILRRMRVGATIETIP